MPRPSLLQPKEKADEHPNAAPDPVQQKPKKRAGLVHIGAYFPPEDTLIIEFAKLGIDLRMTKQDMLHDAIADFVAKHKASRAFR